MNRFTALQASSSSSSSEEEEEEEAEEEVIITATRGTQVIVQPALEAHGVGHLRGQSAVTFYGKCFFCNYTGHSQKHCPLKQCKKCKLWGHAEAACVAPPVWRLPAPDIKKS